jgi:hypothetical protein
VVQFREDPGFGKKGFHVLGLGNPFRIGNLDGDRAVKVVVVSEIDPSEPALAEPTDDPIPPNLGGIDVGEAARTVLGRLRAGGSGQARGFIRGAI